MPITEIQKVELPGSLEPNGRLFGVFMGEPPLGMHLIGIEPDPEGKIGSHGLADRIDHLEGETAAVFHASAVDVLPVVGEG